ncbi:hypothetical protein OPW13_12440 [Vibrio europaeus]|uniref:Uncharacterized protein n=1 Tax=Vibrio europaeus TaxID=300876 RepID=A0A178J9E1_9VIBR|nr:hypothetical protein [Vibrio europaeus]MDC5704666.1 hypothetical protein [Vibrio europaeus]MDC5711580.1 hypothetical protein [Vibrio europaeus]MDC5713495.1 hypothetical protein [Vibrio europaeus]MDC5843394.1 hypothetical protein [Vibrio europaeus]MDC5860043.1 hypothetical protein [Vibrio europaeus]
MQVTQKNRKKVFKMSYDMKDTENHTIDAELLGTSILSMSRALRGSDKILNGESSNIQVEVKAHTEGSFVVEFVTWLNQSGADVLQVLGISAAAGSLASGNVFGVIEQLKSQKITTRVKKTKNTVELQTIDGLSVECDEKVAQIVTDPHIRKELDRIINNPIAGKENAKFVLKDENDQELKVIESDNVNSYKAIAARTLEEVEEETNQVTIYFSQVNFDGPTGWKCKLPNGDIETVRMNDEAFRNRINQGYEEFAKTKPCLVQLKKIVKTKADNQTSTRYTIEEVIRQLG